MSVARFEHVTEKQYEADAAAYPVRLSLQEIPLPCRATAGSAGYDFVCPVDVEIPPDTRLTVPTGIRAEMDPAYVLVLCPRSSLGRRFGLRLSNTLGIVDSDYAHADNEGHILLMLEHSSRTGVHIKAGERICQGIFLPYGTAEEEAVTAERRGGYGSTGR